MALPWKEEYKLGIPEIDAQHQHFVETLNMLYTSIENMDTQEKLNDIFENLIEYTVIHFKTEEKYFKEFNYEEAEEHIKKHNELKKYVAEQKAKYEAGEDITEELTDHLEDWLLEHMDNMDKKYVKCFKEHGL